MSGAKLHAEQDIWTHRYVTPRDDKIRTLCLFFRTPLLVASSSFSFSFSSFVRDNDL
jgi:hypothetical protein